MKILSNDYRSNLPGMSKVAHGGPANFTRVFSTYVSDHGHEWIGLVQDLHEGAKTAVKKQAVVDKKSYYNCSFDTKHYQHILHVEKKIDPRDWFAPQIKAIRQFIRRVQPDLLYLGGYSLYAWMLLEAAHQEGLPITIQHSGISKTEFDQYKHLYSRAGRAIMLDMEREVAQFAAKQVFLNAYSRDYFCAEVAPVPEKQAMIIPLPYLESFAKQASAKKRKSGQLLSASKALTIGCVARWDRIKNHKALLDLARAAKREKLPWTFKSITTIPNTTVQKTFKDAYRKHIEVLPPVEQAQLVPFYQSVDLLVLPSKFDVSPTVVMEAALMGKPTLISNTVGWTSEYRAAGLGDWIVDFKDGKKAVQTMKKLLKKPVPDAFRKHVLAKHKPERVFAAYLKLFASVI